MQDFGEKAGLLKSIDDELAELKKIDDEIGTLKVELSNSVKRFRLSPRMAVTNTSKIAFRQKLCKLADLYVDQEFQVNEIIKYIDAIEP